MIDLSKLKALALAARDAWLIDVWRSCNQSDIEKRMACNALISAANPQVVLELIEALEEARSALAEIGFGMHKRFVTGGWAKYYFEKEFLPGLKREIQERCVITTLTSAKHAGITVDVTFTPRPEK